MPKSKLKEYNQLKKEVEEDRAEADRAEGALAEIMKRLKDEFGCSTIAIAKKQQKKLKKQVEDIESEYDKAVKSYNEKRENE